ncbi:MAG: hypothetical protein H7338_17890 [Candidatus Sericytochromatia bacterium]|nr:hypothetical protein [Candidatus Sericytochromatia bacterium]
MDPLRYLFVNDRPVELIPGPDGLIDCQVYDPETGTFRQDPSYIDRCVIGSASDTVVNINSTHGCRHAVVNCRQALDRPPCPIG